jgi:hypothetical protein
MSDMPKVAGPEPRGFPMIARRILRHGFLKLPEAFALA